MNIRIDKFVSEQAGITRSEAKTAIKKKQVTINGNIVKSADVKLDTEKDIVAYNGKELIYREFMYIMLNNPTEWYAPPVTN